MLMIMNSSGGVLLIKFWAKLRDAWMYVFEYGDAT